MIRPAKPSDLSALVALTLEYIESQAPFPFLRADKGRIKEVMREMISGASHFAYVIEVDGEIDGALVAASHEFALYERRQLSVLLFYCRNGGGGLLVRRMVKWFSSKPAFRACTVVLEVPSERLGRHLQKHGFKPVTMYIGGRHGMGQ